MESIPWFAWILLVGIACGSVAQVVDTTLKHRRKIAELQHGPSRRELTTRLDAIEHRLERIERALTDIPG